MNLYKVPALYVHYNEYTKTDIKDQLGNYQYKPKDKVVWLDVKDFNFDIESGQSQIDDDTLLYLYEQLEYVIQMNNAFWKKQGYVGQMFKYPLLKSIVIEEYDQRLLKPKLTYDLKYFRPVDLLGDTKMLSITSHSVMLQDRKEG